MKTLKRIAAVVACLAAFAARGQGIPVIDAASLTQQLLQVSAWAEQYSQMYQQYQMLTNQLNAIKGARGMGALLNTPGIRQALPSDFVTQFDAIRSLGSVGASQGAQAIYNSIKTFGCEQRYPTDQKGRLQCQASAMVVPQNIDFINGSIASSQGRVGQLQGLIGQIDQAVDAKAAADLSNRINAEIALLQNEKTMMDMALAQLQAQQRLLDQQQKEAGTKRLTEPGVNPFR